MIKELKEINKELDGIVEQMKLLEELYHICWARFEYKDIYEKATKKEKASWDKATEIATNAITNYINNYGK